MTEVKYQVRDSAIRFYVRVSVGRQVSHQVWDQVRDQSSHLVLYLVESDLWNQVHEDLGNE